MLFRSLVDGRGLRVELIETDSDTEGLLLSVTDLDVLSIAVADGEGRQRRWWLAAEIGLVEMAFHAKGDSPTGKVCLLNTFLPFR